MGPLSILPALTWALLTLGVAVDGSIVSDIFNAIEKAVDCPACHGVLAVLNPLALIGDSAFSKTLIAVCKAAKVRNCCHR
jgi:mannose/fructose/N-acetylgalactosamine-specific phosphotransferase system component IID